MAIEQPEYTVERYLKRLGDGRPEPTTLGFYAAIDAMRGVDPFVAKHVVQELVDQRSNIKLIASENYSSLAVQQAHGQPAHRQVRRGLPGAPLLRGLRQRRRHRGARRRARPRPLRRRRTPTCSRTPAPTPTWSRSWRSSPRGSRIACWSGSRARTSRRCPTSSSGAPRRAARPAAARHGLLLGRPPHPRLPLQRLRAALRRPQLHRRPRHRPARPRRAARAGAARCGR